MMYLVYRYVYYLFGYEISLALPPLLDNYLLKKFSTAAMTLF